MKTNWNVAVAPLLKEYAKRKHPLEYNSIYELIVMVVLSAQSTDKIVNTIVESPPILITEGSLIKEGINEELD